MLDDELRELVGSELMKCEKSVFDIKDKVSSRESRYMLLGPWLVGLTVPVLLEPV